MTMTNKRIEQRRTLILLAAFFVFLLLLSYGFPVTGDDWYFTSRHQNESLPEGRCAARTQLPAAMPKALTDVTLAISLSGCSAAMSLHVRSSAV